MTAKPVKDAHPGTTAGVAVALLMVLALLVAVATGARAQATVEAGLDAWEGRVLSDSELDGLRGGFIGVAGITYFAIDLDTWINNQHVYSATWNPGSSVTSVKIKDFTGFQVTKNWAFNWV